MKIMRVSAVRAVSVLLMLLTALSLCALFSVPAIRVQAADDTVAVSSDTSETEAEPNAFEEFIEDFKQKFERTFIREDRWKMFLNGLLVTLKITLFSGVLGIVIGALTAAIRFTYDKTGRLGILNAIAKLYITVIRGTPSTVQLLITYYVIFASVNISSTAVAIAAFGLNSGAYVAEIVRSGMAAVDGGQLEAGRSLGFGYAQSMWYIIIPQAVKNILPALGNEFIVLLKETSISGYIAITDLTRAGYQVQSVTYDALMPLLAVAAIYLVLVMIFTRFVTLLERRLARSDRS